MFLPLAPHIAMLAAVALVSAARQLESLASRRLPAAPVAGGVILAVLLVAAVPATGHVVAARHGETRLEASEWLDANVPAGAFVFREWDMVEPAARHFDFNRRLHDLWDPGWTPELVAHYMDFVVTTSTNFDRVRRQRSRAFFAQRAAYYDEMFNGPLFELAVGFEPDLLTFGPEVRIYRALRPRGPILGPARTELDLLRQIPWVSTIRLRQEHYQEGGFRFRAPGEVMAGKASVRPGGWYALEVSAESSSAAPLEVALGNEWKTFRIEGESKVVVQAFLRQGKIWWRMGPGAGFREEDQLTVLTARLVRMLSALTEGEPSFAGAASAEPSQPKNESAGPR